MTLSDWQTGSPGPQVWPKQQAHVNSLFLITGTVCVGEHDCREGTVL